MNELQAYLDDWMRHLSLVEQDPTNEFEVWVSAERARMLHDVIRAAAFRYYANLINHGRPRKISWRKLNRPQRQRALSLFHLRGAS